MLKLDNLNYDSWQTVYFQRFSVIALELVLVFALHRCVPLRCRCHTTERKKRVWCSANPSRIKMHRYIQSVALGSKQLAHAAALSILLSPGLLIIDQIHFQYNGFLYGILILSLVLARKQSTLLYSGITFAILLCLKHIYLYLSLAYFVYLLRAYCLHPKSASVFRPRFANIFKLGVGVLSVFSVAFGPFVYWGQLGQLKARLFPFSRGLCHAYWAPNVWAMYSFIDRVLILGIYVPPVSPRLLYEESLLFLHLVRFKETITDKTFIAQPSRTVSRPKSRFKCLGQRHERTGGRYLFRRSPRSDERAHLRSNPFLPTGK